MKWMMEKPEPRPQLGDKRVHSWFAIVPCCISVEEGMEIRWWERVYVRQELQRDAQDWKDWTNICFIDRKEYDEEMANEN